jgi:FkbM family methyltransferase
MKGPITLLLALKCGETMVKITNKKSTKNSPTSLLAALGIFGVIAFYVSAPDDSSVGDLLNIEPSAMRSAVGAAEQQSPPDYAPSSTSGLQPVRCQELFRKGYRQDGKTRAEVDDLNPNNDQINARFTSTFASKFWISVHHQTYDKVQFDSIMELGFYKKQALSQAAVEIVQASGPGSRVLDVGSQLGWFSLLSRGLGLEVDAFDPLPSNAFRLCESLFLNHWSNFLEKQYPGPYVNIHTVALSDNDGDVIDMYQKGASLYKEGDGKHTTTVTTTLDKFIEGRAWKSSETIALLKVNTMGMEDKILTGASMLLRSKMVKNVLLGIDISSGGTKAVEALLSASYRLHKWGDSNGPSQDASSLPSSAGSLISSLAAKVSDKEDKQVFLWFKL